MKTSALFIAGCLLLAAPLSAQENPVEFGVDGGFSFLMPDEEGSDNVTILSVPNISILGMTSFRVGIFASPRIAIEPSFSIVRMSEDDYSSTLISLFPSLLYHLKDFDRLPLPYVRLGVGLIHQGLSWGDGDSDSETQFGLGGGVGVKVPFAEIAFFRLEAAFEKWLERGDQEDWEDYVEGFSAVRLSVGISAIIN